MSEDTTSTNDEQLDFDDLDAFSSSFFGKTQNQEPAKPEAEVKETPDDAPNSEVDDTEGEDTTPEPSDEDQTEDDGEEGQEAEPQKKPSRFQERINELTNARREAERREAALLARLEALENPKTEAPVQKTQAQPSSDAPTPTDTNEDGTDKYPLGEFDPSYIRDLTRFSVAEAQAEARAEQERKTAEQTQAQQAEALKAKWDTNQDSARSRYSDYSEKVASLEPVFAGIDPRLGDYLAQTVMAMDKGPEVLYYLANNPDEAKDIMKEGAARATLRLGRLEARFVEEDKPQNPTPARVSKAPEPPAVNKGSAGGRRVTPDDTDDLDAFSAKFFSKKRY